MNRGNPLAAYFRQPGIHIKLPSNGNYTPDDLISFTASGEVAILPMTAADEIILNNPDSLLNGVAIERIIESCCPQIKYAKELPITDVDVIVLAAKLVSYGDGLDLITKCEKCQKDQEFTLSIHTLLNQVKPLPNYVSVRLNDDLVAYLRPYTLQSNNRINVTQFEETQLIRHLVADDVTPEERTTAIASAFEKITNLNLELLAKSIIRIKTPTDDVNDPESITEFIQNTNREIVGKLREGIKQFNSYGLPKETTVKCDNPECKNEWTIPVVYDPSSFFA
jgi:hypothetical protein